MQEAFKFDEESLLYRRELRNAWEHIDERTDAYFLDIDAGFFFPTCILGTHSLADDPAGHILNFLDAEANLKRVHQPE